MIEIYYNGKKGWFLTDQQKKELEDYLFSTNSKNEDVVH